MRGEGKGGHSKGLRGRGQPAAVKRSWQQMCRDLLKSIFEKEDSIPFRSVQKLNLASNKDTHLRRYKTFDSTLDKAIDVIIVKNQYLILL